MNFKTTTAKDIFLTQLKGEELNFGFVEREDKPVFLDFAIQQNLIVFMYYKEYRGILGLYKVLKEFSFHISRNDGVDEGNEYVSVNIGDEIEVSELYPLGRNHNIRYKDSGIERHQIYRYVTDEERAKLYEM